MSNMALTIADIVDVCFPAAMQAADRDYTLTKTHQLANGNYATCLSNRQGDLTVQITWSAAENVGGPYRRNVDFTYALLNQAIRAMDDAIARCEDEQVQDVDFGD